MSNNNIALQKAKIKQDDEYFTTYKDIEKEVPYYKEELENKIIYCNCDNCYESNFFKYFIINFNAFKLKRLITTCYNGNDDIINTLWDDSDISNLAYKIEITEVHKEYKSTDKNSVIIEELLHNEKNKLSTLDGNGSFDSNECKDILKTCDIVITNCPFSRFKEYYSLLREYKKKYLFIANLNAVTYIDVFHDIRDNITNTGINNVWRFIDPITKEFRHGNAIWLTNIKCNKEKAFLTLEKLYNKKDYPTYLTYNAIEVDKLENIPKDYKGIMGVPISILTKYNKNQFEIIGSSACFELAKEISIENIDSEFTIRYNAQEGKRKISNHVPMLCYYDNNGIPILPYVRILIKRKN